MAVYVSIMLLRALHKIEKATVAFKWLNFFFSFVLIFTSNFHHQSFSSAVTSNFYSLILTPQEDNRKADTSISLSFVVLRFSNF